MKAINVDTSKCKTIFDLNNAILSALNAPQSYTRGSLDAVLELMVFGEDGSVEPPYTLRLLSTRGLPPEAAEWLGWIVEGLAHYRADQMARWGQDIEANLVIVS